MTGAEPVEPPAEARAEQPIGSPTQPHVNPGDARDRRLDGPTRAEGVLPDSACKLRDWAAWPMPEALSGLTFGVVSLSEPAKQTATGGMAS